HRNLHNKLFHYLKLYFIIVYIKRNVNIKKLSFFRNRCRIKRSFMIFNDKIFLAFFYFLD
ncbi:MAG TPA: hypothetical protein DEB43_05740, partial [Desulfovibrio sp.]|nr:hypothetical protein [Desulfovibrio sp.]